METHNGRKTMNNLKTIDALDLLKSYESAGAELKYFDGANWYVSLSHEKVAVISTGIKDECKLEFMGANQSARYNDNNLLSKNFNHALMMFELSI